MKRAVRSVDDLRAHLAGLGARPAHARRLLTAWLAGRRLDQEEPPTSARPSQALRAALPGVQRMLDAALVELERHPAPDGSCRRLLRLGSGHTVESVDLPREGLCVSTQVGCAVGCRFCRTGEDGLVAQLSALELLAQVALTRRQRAVRRVVFMGMGEPAHNLDAVLDALTVLGHEGQLPHKNLVFSTVGEPRVFDLLSTHAVRPGLALSLHTLDGRSRGELLPNAPRIPPEELLESALAYADRTTYPLLVQWTLLAGVNDTPQEAQRLAQLLHGRRAIVNYIPFNAVEGSGYRRPPIERCVELVRALRAQRVLATLRRSAGQEVDGACGQLRARHARSGPPPA